MVIENNAASPPDLKSRGTVHKPRKFVDLLDFSHLDDDTERITDVDDQKTDTLTDRGRGGEANKGLNKEEVQSKKTMVGKDDEGDVFESDYAFHEIEREVKQFEHKFGSRYLQVIGVLVISVAFSILGYYPTTVIPIWGQVAFMFLGAAILMLAGEILINRKGMELYSLGLIFAGMKLMYSSFWSTYNNFDLIEQWVFLIAIICTLGFHYLSAIRYRSSALHASFVLLSWVPLAIVQEMVSADEVVVVLFLGILISNYYQAHRWNEATSILMVPVSVILYLIFNGYQWTLYGFTFLLDPSSAIVFNSLIIFIFISLLFLHFHYKSTTVLTEYLNDRPGTSFSHLFSILLAGSIIAAESFLPSEQTIFLISLVFSGLVIVHFHARGESLSPLLISLSLGLIFSLAVSITTLSPSLTSASSSPSFLTMSSPGDSTLLPAVLLTLVITELALFKYQSGMKFTESVEITVKIIPIVLFAISLAGYFIDNFNMAFLPVSYVLIILGFQLYLSYSYIKNIHIITGEILFLILAGLFGFLTNDGLGYSLVWILITIFFGFIILIRKDGPLASITVILLSCDLLITAHLAQDFILLPAFLNLSIVVLVVRWYTGPYFMHQYFIRISEIGIVMKKHRLLDLYNITMVLSLALAVRSITVFDNAWILYPVTACGFLALGQFQTRGKFLLPTLLMICALFLIFLQSLLLLSYLTIFPVITFLLLFHIRNHTIDHYLQMFLFIAVSFSAIISGLEGAWLYDHFCLSLITRLTIIYSFYIFALLLFLHLSKRYASLLLSGMVALGELAALLVFTFEYQHSIQIYMGILFFIIAYFGLYLVDHAPVEKKRNWERDRSFLLWVCIGLFFFPIIMFNFRDDLLEWESWTIGFIGISILFASDCRKNGFHLQRWTNPSTKFLPTITQYEFLFLIFPTIFCMNYVEEYSLWLFVASFGILWSILVVRKFSNRLQYLIIYGLLMFAPFNILRMVGTNPGQLIGNISDIIPVSLTIIYIFIHAHGDSPIGRFMRRLETVEYSWLVSITVLLLGTLGSSSFGMVVVPLFMLFFSYWRKDVIATPAAYIVLMGVFYLYFSIVDVQDQLVHDGLLLFAIAPIFIALINERLNRAKALTFSFSTLSFMLMFAVPWFSAGGGSFQSAVINNVLWSIFGGLAFSSGFYFDRFYLRFYGTFFLILGIIATAWNTVVLGVEAVVGSLLIFGFMVLMAVYFYNLDSAKRHRRNR